MSIASGASNVEVTYVPHPFREYRVLASVPSGQTVAEILGRGDLPVSVWSDGELIEHDRWQTVIPRERMLIVTSPANRDALRLIGFIGLSVLTPFVGAAVGGGLVGGLAAAGTGIAGALAITALIPPTFPSISGAGAPEQLAAITGVSNQVGRFVPIPRPYGTPTYYPPIPMTAQPYTELQGDVQYLRMMVVLGYGPLQIGGVTVGAGYPLIDETTTLAGTPIKIGDTTIDQFDEVEFEIGDPDDVTLYTDEVVETAVNVAINAETAPTTEDETVVDNIQLVQTTDFDTDEAVVELYTEALFTMSGQGNTRYARVTFQIHYSLAGVGSWTLADTFTLSSKERKPLRTGRRIRLPAPAQYDIRLTRVSSYYAQENTYFNDYTWTVLRSVKRNVRAFDVDNTVVMALRIRATDQLGGPIDRLSVTATSILPVFNGSTWVDTPTRNPAWIFADILSGVATRTPVPKGSLETFSLTSWAQFCSENELFFDAVIDASSPVVDRARDVASTGLAAVHITYDGRYGVITDQVLPSKATISPTVASGFSSEYVYRRLPHAVRVVFMDPTTWEPTERFVYDDGYTAANATRIEELQTIGVTGADHAWKIGRYHLAALRLRPETYHWTQGFQNFQYERGDTLNLNYDVILVGLKSGRVTAVNSTTELEVDEVLYMETGLDYGVKISKSDGTIVTVGITTETGGVTTITLDDVTADVSVGDHFIFGEAGAESIKVKITRIERDVDQMATVTAVPAAENIYDAWEGTIPEFDPVLTTPVDSDLQIPTVPTITAITSDSPPSPNGAPRRRLVVAFDLPLGLVGTVVEAQMRTKEVIDSQDVYGRRRLIATVDSMAGVLYVPEVEEGITYAVRLRARRNARVSDWSAETEHTVSDSGWLSVTVEITPAGASWLPYDDGAGGSWSPQDSGGVINPIALTARARLGDGTLLSEQIINCTLTESGANEGDIAVALGTGSGFTLTIVSGNNTPLVVFYVTHTASGARSADLTASAVVPNYDGYDGGVGTK